MTDPADLEAESALCLQCGLCCDGTLFDTGTLEVGEDAPLPEGQIIVVERTDKRPSKREFRLPCARIDGTACTIYPERPVACRTFTCKLLKHFRAGETSQADCLHRIDTARDALRDVAAELELSGTPPVPRRMAIVAHLKAMQQKGELPLQAAVKAVALEHYLDRHFRPDTSAQLVKDADR